MERTPGRSLVLQENMDEARTQSKHSMCCTSSMHESILLILLDGFLLLFGIPQTCKAACSPFHEIKHKHRPNNTTCHVAGHATALQAPDTKEAEDNESKP